jgi:hypothetical protein
MRQVDPRLCGGVEQEDVLGHREWDLTAVGEDQGDPVGLPHLLGMTRQTAYGL